MVILRRERRDYFWKSQLGADSRFSSLLRQSEVARSINGQPVCDGAWPGKVGKVSGSAVAPRGAVAASPRNQVCFGEDMHLDVGCKEMSESVALRVGRHFFIFPDASFLGAGRPRP